MNCSEILPDFKCRSSNISLPKRSFFFIRAVFVSQIYSRDLRDANSTKTSLDSIRVTRICNWIFDPIEYLSGDNDSNDVSFRHGAQRAGVCRDFAHPQLPFADHWQIPARFVSAYAYGLNPPDFHAYMEAFLGDAADTSFATIFGGASMYKMELSMNPGTGQSSSPQYTTDPISNYPSNS